MQGCRFSALLVRALGVLLLVSAVVATAHAKEYQHVTERTKLQIGDKVQINQFNKWFNAEVVGLNTMGHLIHVKYYNPTFKRVLTTMVRFEDIRIEVKSGRDAKSPASTAGTGNPFEPDKGFRTWQDDSGKFKIEAELAGVEGDSVRLKRRDGTTITVALSRLSEADRQFVERLQGKSGGEPSEEAAAEEDEPSAEEDEYVDELPTKRAEMENVEVVLLSADAAPSNLEPDGGVAVATLTRRVVALPPKSDFFERAGGLFVAAAAPNQVMIPFSKMNEHGKPTRVVLCDLKQGGQRARSLAFSADALAMDIGPAGDLILSRANGFHFGTKSRVDLWRVKGNKLEHELGWKPYAGEDHGGRDGDVEWAAFVDAERVLTLSGSNKLVLWKLPEVRAVYSLDVCFHTQPAFSAGRKYLAALTDVGLAVLDAKTGEVKGVYPTAEKSGMPIFRPDGKQLALVTPYRLVVWEFADGKVYRDIGCSVGAVGRLGVAWPSKDYILVGGRYLVDLPRYSVLWDYQGSDFAESISRQFWCLCSDRNSLALVPLPLPHQAAQAAASQLKPEDYRAIEPGVTVSLEVNVSVQPDQAQQIQQHFESQLKDRGMKIAAGSPYKLVVCTKLGELETLQYEESRGLFPLPRFRGPFGGPSGPVRTINFQDQVSEIAFLVNGQQAWAASATVRAPDHIAVAQDQTPEQAVQNLQKPNVNFFYDVQIPSYVAKPRDMISFGASRLTPQGLRPAEVQRKNATNPQRSPGVFPAQPQSGGDRRV
jgi:hypothetical protein